MSHSGKMGRLVFPDSFGECLDEDEPRLHFETRSVQRFWKPSNQKLAEAFCLLS
jgi:hypothetical protein